MARRWSTPALSARSYQRITLIALFLLAFIVVTGAAVRLAGAGLGCPDWPTCADGNVVAPWEFRAWIEFGNRLVTGLVSVIVMLAVLGALFRAPRRRDLTLLSLGLVAGVLGQIVLGGLVVLFHLAPPLVMGHFIVSMILVLDAVVLNHRAGLPDDLNPAGWDGRGPVAAVPTSPVVGPDRVRMIRLVGVAAAIVLFLGTVVTASGPHPGSHGDELVERLPFALHQVTRLHGIAVMLFLALVVFTAWSLARDSAPRGLLRRAEILLVVIVAQAGVGYVQYFTRLPAVLVGVHIAGATAVWVATLHFNLGVRAPVGRRATEPVLATASA